MKDKVRVGIIGVGQQGERHVQNYQKVPDAKIVAIADLSEEVRSRISQQYGIADTYEDYQQLLERDDIDSVDIILHNRLHKQAAIDALEAGKNVYIEKPLSWTYPEAKAIYDTAKAKGRMLHVQLAQIYTPDTRGAKRLIEGGFLGDLYYAKTSHYRRRGRPYVDGYGTRAFVNLDTSGGGAMIDMAVYHISQMLFLLGNPRLEAVSGKTFQKLDNIYEQRRQDSGYDVEELGMGIARLENDVTLLLEEAWAIHGDDPNADYIYGSHGGLRVSPLTYYTTLADMEMDGTFDTKQADVRWQRCDPNEACFSESQMHWISAQLRRVPLIDTAGIALNTAFITEGIYISSHLGREVTAADIESAPPGFGRIQ